MNAEELLEKFARKGISAAEVYRVITTLALHGYKIDDYVEHLDLWRILPMESETSFNYPFTVKYIDRGLDGLDELRGDCQANERGVRVKEYVLSDLQVEEII